MSNDALGSVQEIERAVRGLTLHDLAAFRERFAEYDAEACDRRFEADVPAG